MRIDLNQAGQKTETLSKLTPEMIAGLEESLSQVGTYGEVHLVVEKGNLCFVRTVRSEAVTGELDRDSG